MKDKRQPIFALIFLLIAGLLTAGIFISNKTRLNKPFGKEYEVAKIVYRTPIISAEELGEKVPWLRVREDCVTYVDVSGHEWECSAAEKFELTAQNFAGRGVWLDGKQHGCGKAASRKCKRMEIYHTCTDGRHDRPAISPSAEGRYGVPCHGLRRRQRRERWKSERSARFSANVPYDRKGYVG